MDLTAYAGLMVSQIVAAERMEYLRADDAPNRKSARRIGSHARDSFGSDMIRPVPLFKSSGQPPWSFDGMSPDHSNKVNELKYATLGSVHPRTPPDRRHKAARFECAPLHSEHVMPAWQDSTAHAAFSTQQLPEGRSSAASQRGMEISDSACAELDLAVQSGVLPVHEYILSVCI